MTFSDQAVAARLRDIIERSVVKVMDRDRPSDKFGEVVEFNTALRTVKVLLPGSDTPITARAGSVMPTAAGQIVRIGGINHQWYVEDVLGVSQTVGAAPDDLGPVAILNTGSGVNSITIQWDIATRYPEYRVEWAKNDTFTLEVGSKVTNNIETYVIHDLDAGDDYWIRIYAGNGNGDFSDSSVAVGPLRTLDTAGSDGSAPAFSPQPVVDAGLRQVLARWARVPQSETVIYEVYASDTSGFTPDQDTLIGETTANFYILDEYADGTPVSTSSPTFVRLIAYDSDGRAPAGAQGFDTAKLIEAGDIGNVPYSAISDGSPPQFSPAPTVTSAIKSFFLEWLHPPNADQVTYEIHISTQSGFTPATTTLVGDTVQNFAWIHNQAVADGAGELQHGTQYYIRLVAKDNDGVASPGAQVGAVIGQTTAGDLADNAVNRQHIANAAIGDAQIEDLSVTGAKIANATIGGAKIQDASIGTAQIGDLAVTAAKIQDATITSAKISELSANKISSGSISSAVITLDGAAASIRSDNFISGSTGFRILGDGTAEFNDVDVRGEIHIGGFDGTSFHVDTDGNMWMGGDTYANSTFRISSDGNVLSQGNIVLDGGAFRTDQVGSPRVVIDGTLQPFDGQQYPRIKFDDNNGISHLFGGGSILGMSSGTAADIYVQSGGAGSFCTMSAGPANFQLSGGNDEISGSADLVSLDADTQLSMSGGEGEIFITDEGLVLARGTGTENQFIKSMFANSEIRIRNSNDVAGIGISVQGYGMIRPQLTTGTPEVLRHAAGAENFGIVTRASSSERWKRDIRFIDGDEALRVARAIKPITFMSDLDTDAELGMQHGFSAENVAAAHNALAYYDDEGMPSGVNTTMLLAYLWAAWRELDARG